MLVKDAPIKTTDRSLQIINRELNQQPGDMGTRPNSRKGIKALSVSSSVQPHIDTKLPKLVLSGDDTPSTKASTTTAKNDKSSSLKRLTEFFKPSPKTPKVFENPIADPQPKAISNEEAKQQPAQQGIAKANNIKNEISVEKSKLSIVSNQIDYFKHFIFGTNHIIEEDMKKNMLLPL